MNKQQKNLKKYDTYNNMKNAECFKSFAKEHGTNAVIPVLGMTYDQICAKVAELFEII